MARKDKGEHDADRIPAHQVDEVKRLLAAGDQIAAGKLLYTLCVKHKLKSYEAHHLAAHLMKTAGSNHDTVEGHSPTDCQFAEIVPVSPT